MYVKISSDRRHWGDPGNIQQATCYSDGRALSSGPAARRSPRHHYRPSCLSDHTNTHCYVITRRNG